MGHCGSIALGASKSSKHVCVATNFALHPLLSIPFSRQELRSLTCAATITKPRKLGKFLSNQLLDCQLMQLLDVPPLPLRSSCHGFTTSQSSQHLLLQPKCLFASHRRGFFASRMCCSEVHRCPLKLQLALLGTGGGGIFLLAPGSLAEELQAPRTIEWPNPKLCNSLLSPHVGASLLHVLLNLPLQG